MMKSMEEKIQRYQRSEVTIAALHEKSTNVFYNIYSLVELCTKDQIKSDSIGDEKWGCIREKLDDEYTLYLRRVFFDNPWSGYNFFKTKGVRPIHSDAQNKSNDVLLDYGDMNSEPDGTEGILFHYDSWPKSKLEDILPNFSGTIRVHMQISANDKFLHLLSDKSMLKAGSIIQKNLGIPLLEHQEYWGSVFLCMPNPFLKRVELRLGKECKKLLVRLLPRMGQKLINGVMELVDERTLGTGFCCRQKITGDRFVIDMPNEPERLRYRIYTEEGELVAESANYFVKQINFQMAVSGARRIFEIPGQPASTEVEMKTYQDFSVGDNGEMEYAKRLKEEERKRSLEFLEKNRIFLYFPGNREDSGSRDKAVGVVKDIIGKATKTCVLCDPFFSYQDFLNYGVLVSSTNIILHLVTSEEFLLHELSETDHRMQGDMLSDILTQSENQHIKVQCHVLKGKKRSPLHDRFMLIDEDVYVLGSSFSEFGSRATMLYKIPNPDKLRSVAQRWIRNEGDSISINEWKKRRDS